MTLVLVLAACNGQNVTAVTTGAGGSGTGSTAASSGASSASGGNATGGSATGGSATGGNATGGDASSSSGTGASSSSSSTTSSSSGGTGSGAAFPGVPAASGTIALDSTGTLLFVGSSASKTVSAFVAGANGLKAVSPNGKANAGRGMLVIDPVSHFLYTPDLDTPKLHGFSFSADGALTPVPGSPVTVGDSCFYAAIDPLKKQLYTSCRNSFAIYQLDVDAATGAMTAAAGSPFSVVYGNEAVLINPAGKFFFVANDQSGNPGSIFGYPMPISGSLAGQLPGSPTSIPVVNPFDIAMPGSGDFLYVAGASSVDALSVGANGSLTPLAPPSVIPGSFVAPAVFIAVDSAGGWVATGNGTAPVSMYPVQANGSLGARMDHFFASSLVTGIAFDPPLGTVYVADNDKVHAFWLDYGTGMLTEQPGSPYPLP